MLSVTSARVHAVVSFVGGSLEISLFEEVQDAERYNSFGSRTKPSMVIPDLEVSRTSFADWFHDDPRMTEVLDRGEA
jgi:hypothetical protein